MPSWRSTNDVTIKCMRSDYTPIILTSTDLFTKNMFTTPYVELCLLCTQESYDAS